MKKQNVVEEVRDQLKSIWIHRKGNDAHAAVLDVIDALWPKIKPLVTKKIKVNDDA